MKCKKEGCGADLGPDAQFCSDCGTKVTTPTLIKSAICPSCNNFVLEDHKFCLKCGTRVDPALFTDKVCSGTKKDGGKCNTVLASGANFCLSCGISTLQADDIKENNGKQLKRKAKEEEKAETTKKEEKTELWKLLEEINLLDKLTNETHVQNTQEDTNHELEWLKIVEESHGSLKQAEAINTSGTYYIGNVKKEKGKQQNQLSDVLGLTVTVKQEGDPMIREYNYAQLHDLQSRLMLVAGKAEMGKDDVYRFILILDSVVRLCNVYIKLLSSGCVLFSKFQVVFRCDPTSKACAFVNFGAGDDKQTIRGKTDKFNKDVSFFIPRIAKFLEECHDRWLKFIDNERETHCILNFFTIEQMVILQEELVKLGFDTEPSNLVYPLLSIIKHDCTKEDLIEAMEEARKEIEEMYVDNQEEEEEILMKDETTETIRAKFILEMVEAGYSEEMAMEALNHVDPDEINEGIAWCIEHDGDEELETLPVNNETSEPEKKFPGWNTADSSLSTVRKEMLQSILVGAGQGTDDSVEPLIEKLEKLWEAFVTSISSSVSDYLSVEHLALILRKLAELDDHSLSNIGK